MSLTLVQLAQAIEDGKSTELKHGGEWVVRGSVAEMFEYYFSFPDRVRIKPEPRVFWVIDGIPLKFLTKAEALGAAKVDAHNDPVIYHCTEVIE